MKTIIIFIISITICVGNLDSQDNNVLISGGYSYQGYQFSIGTGYNLSLGFEKSLIQEKIGLGFQIVLSNTYANRNFAYTADRIDITIGGLNYIDYPDGINKINPFPIDNYTYKELDNRGYLKQYKPKESYFHNFYTDLYLKFRLCNISNIIWDINTGIGIGIANTSEDIGSYEAPFLIDSEIRTLNVVSRETKHLYLSVNISNLFSYSFNDNYSVFCRQSIAIVPKMLINNNLGESLIMLNLGLKFTLP